MFKCLKPLVDMIMNPVKVIEEWVDPDCTCLEGFTRSLQLDGYSCGAQCTFMILRYFGKARSIENVTRELATDTDGTSQTQIRTLLKRRGLHPKRISSPKLRHLREAIDSDCPLLISVDDGEHWVVVYGYSPRKIYIADPALYSSIVCQQFSFWQLRAKGRDEGV
jgi:ABC-type bacteriocin/lantibiotic exporter with double-glycine peptidase domain